MRDQLYTGPFASLQDEERLFGVLMLHFYKLLVFSYEATFGNSSCLGDGASGRCCGSVATSVLRLLPSRKSGPHIDCAAPPLLSAAVLLSRQTIAMLVLFAALRGHHVGFTSLLSDLPMFDDNAISPCASGNSLRELSDGLRCHVISATA